MKRLESHKRLSVGDVLSIRGHSPACVRSRRDDLVGSNDLQRDLR